MFKSIIITGKTIGTLSAKAGKATGRATVSASKAVAGTKVAQATASGTVRAAKATKSGAHNARVYIAAEYFNNKVVNVEVGAFPFETLA